MRWSQLRRLAISLPLAILAAVLLVGINEAGYKRSRDALDNLSHIHNARTSLSMLLQNMLDAETGMRGYLLTNDERYLEPYEKAVS